MIISKVDMKAILAKMMRSYRLIAPASNGKVVDFLEITDVDAVLMDNRIAYKSLKEFFLPQYEKLMSFENGEAVANVSRLEKIIFGAKPCDLEALDTMSQVFIQGKFEDPYFAAHFENNLIIGTGCQEKKPGCFCEQVSVDMGYSNKCDLFLEDMGNSYRVLYVSDRGKEKLTPFIPELSNFDEVHEAKQLTPALGLPQDTAKTFHQVDWESAVEICQGCGLCTFICPTCHCFLFKESPNSRYRSWDSCMFQKSTLHASGHNPRESKTERYRNRVLHKFVYISQNIGAAACTGCGRCIRSCPAGMNIQRIVQEIQAELSLEGLS